jgi:hypothetical protein
MKKVMQIIILIVVVLISLFGLLTMDGSGGTALLAIGFVLGYWIATLSGHKDTLYPDEHHRS